MLDPNLAWWNASLDASRHPIPQQGREHCINVPGDLIKCREELQSKGLILDNLRAWVNVEIVSKTLKN
jgi:hypothetical protein